MKNIILCSLILILIGGSHLIAQSSATISKPILEREGNRVKIAYDIEDHGINDEFNVWIEITDANGKPIDARAVTGDVGNRIQGGRGKEITWVPSEDGITLDLGVYVQVFAEARNQPERSAVTEPASRPPSNSNVKKANMGAIVGQSLILPGLGLARETGKPHWLRGVAGYGCIASAITFNQMASSNYDLYLAESDITTRSELFDLTENQNSLSSIFAYAAIGIWVTDVVWNLVGTSQINNARMSHMKGFSIEPGFDVGSSAPLLALKFSF